MKVGILTFHWATNYGAILQCYALCSYLIKKGYEVRVINYKPKKFNNNLWTFLRYKKFLHFHQYLKDVYKESLLKKFRKKYLPLTHRFYTERELDQSCTEFDILISGSDQVMNTFFLEHGESNGSTAYFLGFGDNSISRIGYAISFGTVSYPSELSLRLKEYIKRFKSLSVRENTGRQIFSGMGRSDSIVVPDPTLLLDAVDYEKIIGFPKSPTNWIFVYILHNRSTLLANIKKSVSEDTNIKISSNESIEFWLDNIRSSESVITNSYHGTVFSLIFHRPFLVVLKQRDNVGMNDRFYTLLGKCNLLDRITDEMHFSLENLYDPIDWESVDEQLNDFKKAGADFLNKI